MVTLFTPDGMAKPAANYNHVAIVPRNTELVFLSGQLGVRVDGTVPESAAEQTDIAFQNIRAGLEASGSGLDRLIRVNAMVTDRRYLADYMAVRDRYVSSPAPTSTLIIVSGFARPEFKVEVEVIAARYDVLE